MNRTGAETLVPEVARVCRELADGGGSVAVIADDSAAGPLRDALVTERVDARLLGEPRDRTTDPDTADDVTNAGPGVTLVPVTLAKGLEFDSVVLIEPADIADGNDRGLQRLYVALTRAVTRLEVIHTRDLPELLRDEPVLSAQPA